MRRETIIVLLGLCAVSIVVLVTYGCGAVVTEESLPSNVDVVRSKTAHSPSQQVLGDSEETSEADEAGTLPLVDEAFDGRDEDIEPLVQNGPRLINIAAAGDLVFSHRLIRAWRAMNPNGLEEMLEGYSSLLRDGELALLNLETPLVDDVVPMQAGWPPVLGTPPGVAEVLAHIGVDVVSLANNHSYDQGHLGLARTIELLDGVGIPSLGANTSLADAYGPTFIEHQGARIALLASTGPMNQQPSRRGGPTVHVARLWDETRVLAGIEAARGEAELVILYLHWSVDFVPRPTRSQRRLVQRLVEAGADIIIGSGPHVLQQIERLESPRGEALVAYSLGNLLSSMAFRYRPGVRAPVGYVHLANVKPEARDGALLHLQVELAQEGTVRFSSLEAVPLWTVNTALDHETRGGPLVIRVAALRDAPIEVAEERRPIIDATLGDAVELLQ